MILSPSNRVAKVETYYFATKLAEIACLNKEGKNIINLGIGSPDLSAPDTVIDTLKETVHEPNANQYQSYRGIPELREAFAAFYSRIFNARVNPETEVLPLIGSKEGIMHISMAFLNEGDQVLIPDPGYPTYASATKLAGGIPMAYDLVEKNEWLPDLENLSKQNLKRVKIIWINYPHMPTGQCADRAFYKTLIDFALEYGILICHDNPYSFILNDNPLSIMELQGSKECCLELTSLSKSFNMAGWRVGAVIGAEDYIDHILRFKSNMDSGMYKPIQIAACEALNLGQEWFDDLNAIYTERRKKIWKILDLLDCEYSRDSAGMFVWAKPKERKDIETWIDQILYEAEVFIAPGFIFGNNGREYIRISLCRDKVLLDKAIDRIGSFVNQKVLVS